MNTGFVLAGYVGLRDEYTVMGDTVNVANRLENVAEPGSVIISEGTFRLVRGLFMVRRLASPLQLRGKTEPVTAYLVDGVVPQGQVQYQRGDSLETHMVARQAEMERLNELYKKCLQTGRPILALVTGESGLGKSRLMMEFTSHLQTSETNLTLLSARALAQAAQVPFFLWKSLWHFRFGLMDEDPLELAQEKFLREFQRLWGRQLGPVSSIEAAHFIGSLTGLDWPNSPFLAKIGKNMEARTQRAFELTRELFHRLSSYTPTVLILDDLQWADSGSLELLSYLIDPTENQYPLMILVGSRPELLARQPRWNNFAEIVELKPLPIDADIVGQAFPDLKNMPKEVLQELAVRADGNPYFLEEMVKGLLKSLPGGPSAVLPTDQMLVRLRATQPESLRVMLQARLDGLSREARSIALLASVVGRVFWVGAIFAQARITEGSGTGPLSLPLSDDVINRLIQDALRQLSRAELAFPRANSRFSGDQEFIFKHSLLREVAYGLIPHKNRARYHLAVAMWMADHPNPDFQIMAAEHFERGGAIGEAVKYYDRAAEYSLQRGAVQEAKGMLQHAVDLRQGKRSV